MDRGEITVAVARKRDTRVDGVSRHASHGSSKRD
jgi:hypothetical protein